MVSWPYTTVSFLVGSTRELTPFELEYLRLELGIGVLELVGPSIEVLFELEILVGELVDNPFHIQDAVVGDLVVRIGYGRRINWASDDEGSVGTAAFWTFGVSTASGHDGQEFG